MMRKVEELLRAEDMSRAKDWLIELLAIGAERGKPEGLLGLQKV
jgi:hypothetical protein